MSLSALQRESLPADQQEIIGNTTYVIDEAIRSLREISNNLSPHVLNDFGLARGIQNFVGKSSAMHDVKIRFTTNLRSERYDTDVEVILYRVVCELVNKFAQTFGVYGDQPFALQERRYARARLYGQRTRVQPCRRDRLRHGVVEHRFAYQLPERAVRHHECQRRRYAGEKSGSAPRLSRRKNCNDGTLQNYIGGRSLAVPQRGCGGLLDRYDGNSGRGRGFDRRGISGDAAATEADVVFMDPPRSGSTEAFLDAVARLAPKTVVYISCGPETQARDVKYLLKKAIAQKAPGRWICPHD